MGIIATIIGLSAGLGGFGSGSAAIAAAGLTGAGLIAKNTKQGQLGSALSREQADAKARSDATAAGANSRRHATANQGSTQTLLASARTAGASPGGPQQNTRRPTLLGGTAS